jgi:hypothetical protein
VSVLGKADGLSWALGRPSLDHHILPRCTTVRVEAPQFLHRNVKTALRGLPFVLVHLLDVHRHIARHIGRLTGVLCRFIG